MSHLSRARAPDECASGGGPQLFDRGCRESRLSRLRLAACTQLARDGQCRCERSVARAFFTIRAFSSSQQWSTERALFRLSVESFSFGTCQNDSAKICISVERTLSAETPHFGRNYLISAKISLLRQEMLKLFRPKALLSVAFGFRPKLQVS